MENIKRILELYKPDQLDKFLKENFRYDLNERGLEYEDIENNWQFIGNNPNNYGNINIVKDNDKAIIERITNAIDAVIEKSKADFNIKDPKTAEDVIKVSFPNYYKNIKNIENGLSTRQNPVETIDKVIVALSDSTRSNRPTLDIIDNGTGIPGPKFKDTILSLNHGNKSSIKKSYLIGAFGQGGSTALPFSYATIIISKFEKKIYFTVIKKVIFEDSKMPAFVYLAPKGNILELDSSTSDNLDEYLQTFLNFESGTLIRMIDCDIDQQYRENDIAKPGMLGDFINTELFKVGIPVKVVENRKQYLDNKHSQNRYSYGTFYKLHTWKYAKKDYFGTINIEFKGKAYKINYYFILPEDENLWGNDSECKKAYKQFNVHLNPIIYTVNGQYITSERFTKLKNAGLSFLQYRLLVNVDLDVLGKEKYYFFTSDRSQIQEHDLSKGFIDKIIEALANEKTIIEMNEMIANKSVDSSIDDDMLNSISNEVKGIYNKFLKKGGILPGKTSPIILPKPNENIYYDEIRCFEIVTDTKEFYKNENINVTLKTDAMKHINEQAQIDITLDGRSIYTYTQSNMNGKIQFSLSQIEPGDHIVKFFLVENDKISKESNEYSFSVLNENLEQPEESKAKMLDLAIEIVDERETIVDIEKNENDKKIKVYVCLNHDMLMREVYGKNNSSDEISSIKTKIIKPMALFPLILGQDYDKLEDFKEKNNIILSFVKTVLTILD